MSDMESRPSTLGMLQMARLIYHGIMIYNNKNEQK